MKSNPGYMLLLTSCVPVTAAVKDVVKLSAPCVWKTATLRVMS